MKVASPDIQLELEDRTLTLRFTVRAMAALQDHWELETFDEVMHKISTMNGGDLTADDYGAIMWAALRTHHADIGKAEAMEVLDYIGLPNFTILLTQSAAAAFPQGDGGKASARPPAPKSRGG